MRGATPPATYAEIADALGISQSTAYRWANPEALELDRMRSRKPGSRLAIRDAERLHELRQRFGRRGPGCRRCGARPEDGGAEACWRCRIVEGHARSADRVMRLIERGVEADPGALRAADPTLGEIDVELFLRQLRALGWLEMPGATTDDLAHREIVQGLADARPTEIGHLDPVDRTAATVAAGCLVALRPRR